MQDTLSKKIYSEACQYFPGGVNSPVRAFKNVNSQPFVVKRGEGSKLIDVDDNHYIDYVLSWGPLALGHQHPSVKDAVIQCLDKGWTYGAPCEAENRLAAKVKELVPSMEMMRFVSSGTEAVMGALRLARGFTGRDYIIKCDGGYHGHSDGLLVNAGSGLATFGTSSSAGVPQSYAEKTIVIPLNDSEALATAFKNFEGKIAAFICEPVAGNIGVIPPKAGFLQESKRLCQAHGALLIFDEVMCGFRASIGGAQQLYGVIPDITVLGKVIGGGFPVGAYGARRELMEMVAPLGPVYQAGTLSGNPVAMVAGLKTLSELQIRGQDTAMTRLDELQKGIEKLQSKLSFATCFQRVGTMFSLFLCEGPLHNYQDVCKTDTQRFAKFHRKMLEHGIFFAPSPFEASFISSVHSPQDIEHTLDALEKVLLFLS
jgi:glutamate-1-semialdehyde 2,1-aminomutase